MLVNSWPKGYVCKQCRSHLLHCLPFSSNFWLKQLLLTMNSVQFQRVKIPFQKHKCQRFKRNLCLTDIIALDFFFNQKLLIYFVSPWTHIFWYSFEMPHIRNTRAHAYLWSLITTFCVCWQICWILKCSGVWWLLLLTSDHKFPCSNPTVGWGGREFNSWLYSASLQRVFHYYFSIVSIWLR